MVASAPGKRRGSHFGKLQKKDRAARYQGYFLNFLSVDNMENAMNLDSLLISRDAALLGVLRPALEKISVDIEVCPEFRLGHDLLSKRKFDAVIIDCDDLPHGSDLLKSLRQTQGNAKAVAFAVVNGKTTTQDAFQAGANFVLQKPVTPLHAARCFNAALNFMVRERRRYFRHPLEMPIRIGLPNHQEMRASATNLSEGGMAVRLVAKLPKDSQVKLSFSLPEANISLDVEGQIAWSDQSGRAGVRFVSVPQSMQYQLEKWLTDRLQEEMPQQLHGYVALP
jgi:DNA-binding response OmpR family regulator